MGRFHLERPVSGMDLAPVDQHPQRGNELHARGRLALVRLAAEDQAVLPARCADGALLAAEAGAERDPAGLIAAQANHQDLRRRTGKHLPGEDRAALLKTNAGHAAIEVQLAVVLGDLAGGGELQDEVPQRLIRPQRPISQQLACDEGLGLRMLPSKQQATDFRQVPVGADTIVVRPAARPDGVFVELKPLLVDAAVDHGAEPAVAHRQRLQPVLSRLAIPEPRPRGRTLLCEHKRRGECDCR